MDAPSPIFKALPIELLRLILIHLPSGDLKNLRLACKSLANIAAEFLLPKVHLIFTAKSLARLRKISLHPVFSQHVTSIFYEGDRLEYYEKFEEWRAEVNLDLLDWSHQPPRICEDSLGIQWENMQRMERKLAKGWKRYNRLYSQQQELEENHTDEREIVRAILRFPKLNTISLSLDSALDEPSTYLNESFKKGLVRPQGGHVLYSYEPSGLRQYISLMRGFCVPEKLNPEALLASGVEIPSSFNPAKSVSTLRVLHLASISWLIFKAVPLPAMSAINASLCNLVDLILDFVTGHDEDSMPGVEIEMCRDCLDEGHLLDFVASAPKLERLHISFDFMYPSKQAASLEYIVGSKKWPKLGHITLGNVFATQAQLVAFFERHRETLHNWCFSSMCLEAGADWKDALKEIRDVGPWKNAQVCGELMVEGIEEGYPSLVFYEEMATVPQLKVMRSIKQYLTRKAEEVDLTGANVEDMYPY